MLERDEGRREARGKEGRKEGQNFASELTLGATKHLDRKHVPLLFPPFPCG